MEVTVHSCTDQLHSFHGNKNFGLNDEGYNKAMEWINEHQEWRGGERYEYFGVDMEIKFMWDMTVDEFKTLVVNRPHEGFEDLREYMGALFFGNFKLEFILTEDGSYCNCYQYGANDGTYFSPYAYLEDGTPYEERETDIAERIQIHKRRTFEAFAKNIEEQVIKLLDKYPIYIEDALVETNPTKWYPDGQCNVTRDITRIA